jgi:NitT/TauT family transport system permease protein
MTSFSSWFEIRKPIPKPVYFSVTAIGFLFSFLFYAWASHQPWINNTFIPTPEQIGKAALEIFASEELWLDLKISVIRVTSGFLLAAILGIPIGILIGSFRIGEAFLQSIMEFLRYVPVPALIPLIMIFFGIGEAAKIMLIFVGTFFQVVLMVADEVRRVPFELIQMSQTLGATRSEIVTKVLFRAAIPAIFDALRLCNGWAWTYVVVSELVAATEGLGYRILRFYRYIQTPKIYVYLILLGLLGLLIDILFRKLNRRLFSWADTSKR